MWEWGRAVATLFAFLSKVMTVFQTLQNEAAGRAKEKERNAKVAANHKRTADAARSDVARRARDEPDRLRDDDGFRRD